LNVLTTDRTGAKKLGMYPPGAVVQLREGVEGPDQRVGHVVRTFLAPIGYSVQHGRAGDKCPFNWGQAEVERVGWRRALRYRVTGR